MKAVIFDIDGTIANVEHRQHHVLHKPKNWKAFFDAQVDDQPYEEIVWLLNLIATTASVLVATGRGEEHRLVTETFLTRARANYTKLYMKALKDNRPDDVVKGEMLDKIIAEGYEPIMVIDDRDRVVKMWRERGLRCLQVASGNY